MIHCSSSTVALLELIGGYDIEKRGIVEIKVRNVVNIYITSITNITSTYHTLFYSNN